MYLRTVLAQGQAAQQQHKGTGTPVQTEKLTPTTAPVLSGMKSIWQAMKRAGRSAQHSMVTVQAPAQGSRQHT